jgi:hypothetical protein
MRFRLPRRQPGDHTAPERAALDRLGRAMHDREVARLLAELANERAEPPESTPPQ